MPDPEDLDDDAELDVPDADADDADDEGDDAEEFVPPTKEEWAKTQEALKKANAEAKKNRLALRAAVNVADPKAGEDAEKVREATVATWKPRVVKSAARASLISAGADESRVTRLLAMIDVGDCDVDDDGDVVGLDEQIDSLKDDLPELFGGTAPPPKVRRRVETGDRGAGQPKPKSASERQAAALGGGR